MKIKLLRSSLFVWFWQESVSSSNMSYPFFDCKIFDGAAVVHSLSSKTTNTFTDYADQVFVPFLLQQLEDACRVDLVWDRYTLLTASKVWLGSTEGVEWELRYLHKPRFLRSGKIFCVTLETRQNYFHSWLPMLKGNCGGFFIFLFMAFLDRCWPVDTVKNFLVSLVKDFLSYGQL